MKAAFQIVDSRVCWRCGARAGNCAHIPQVRECERTVTPPRPSIRSEYAPWKRDDLEKLYHLKAAGVNNEDAARLLGRTVGSVNSRVWREKLEAL